MNFRKIKFTKIISKCLIVILTLSMTIGFKSKEAYADSFKVVTLGADLSDKQKEDMMKYFGVTKNDANVLEVTKPEEDKYLANIATKSQIGTRSISCAYVEPTDKGGLTISTHNISWVTEDMIKNALITAGVENAKVKAAAPFVVSGTAALTGILKGFESSKGGKKIDENKKKVANEELMVTGQLGEKIGKKDAANLINEIKKDVVKEKPKTEKEIEKIVKDTANNYKSKLSDEDIKKITSLMTKINSLDLDFNKIKDQLNDVSKKLKENLNSEETKGFLSKVGTFFKSIKDIFVKIFTAIGDFFSNIFSSYNYKKDTNIKYAKYENKTCINVKKISNNYVKKIIA